VLWGRVLSGVRAARISDHNAWVRTNAGVCLNTSLVLAGAAHLLIIPQTEHPKQLWKKPPTAWAWPARKVTRVARRTTIKNLFIFTVLWMVVIVGWGDWKMVFDCFVRHKGLDRQYVAVNKDRLNGSRTYVQTGGVVSANYGRQSRKLLLFTYRSSKQRLTMRL